MTKIVMTNDDGRTVEMEGSAVVSFIINPAVEKKDERLPDAMSLMMGAGAPKNILTALASCMGSLLTQVIEDPGNQILMSMLMMRRFKDAIIGEGVQVDVEEKSVRHEE